MKNFEVEISGPLSERDIIRARELLKSWTFQGTFDRYLINFTTEEMRRRQLDVRARITNGIPELVIKHGEWGSGKRLETLVECQRGQFFPLIMSLSALGFHVGIGAHRISERYQQNGMEFAIIYVKDYTCFYEAELMVSMGEEDEAMTNLLNWAKNNGLHVFDKQEYLSFIDDLDKNANDRLNTREESSLEVIRQRIAKYL